MSDPIVIYYSRLRLVLAVLGCVLFVAAGWFLVRSEDQLNAFIGILNIAFFGLCLIYALWRLVRRKPALIIDDRGITITATDASLVRWAEIDGFHIFRYRNQKMLGILVADPDAVMARFSPFKQWLMRMNMRVAGTPIVVPRGALAISLEELVPLIEARRAAR